MFKRMEHVFAKLNTSMPCAPNALLDTPEKIVILVPRVSTKLGDFVLIVNVIKSFLTVPVTRMDNVSVMEIMVGNHVLIVKLAIMNLIVNYVSHLTTWIKMEYVKVCTY